MLHIHGQKAFALMLEEKMMLRRYAYIMGTVDKVNVALDREFQKTFNSFYKVRLPDTSYYEGFYRVFEQSKAKRKELTYGGILDELYSITGRVEASFASKILATLDENRPIWDGQVLNYLNVKISGRTNKERLGSAKALYSKIEELYHVYLQTAEARENIALFDRYLPDYAWISDTKKMDYMMWELGK